ncbi:MAG: hypothetical protein GWN79_17175, partial [Actinobacteria bacterium]|nr:hypothetical protein [Actinomycetota bacterium]NIS33697.1 hypothetical protein [Actinomycetota bacterium]NIT97028.1 hypothetical protein [Actinomycetota bacterium]NIU20698.1 hypothetical protein [Actinomycetota bacterium]NIU68548.1 hypothetical protein [Actinomycetota bacterium]
MRSSDANPERIQVQLDAGLLPGAPWPRAVGDRLGDLVGVVGYGFGNFEVRPTQPFDVEPGGLAGETTPLVGDPEHLVVATFNVENLEPSETERIEAL